MLFEYEPVHDKSYNETSEVSDQPVDPSSMARVLIYPSLDSPEAVKLTCAQRRL